jgi:hypothetical protein
MRRSMKQVSFMECVDRIDACSLLESGFMQSIPIARGFRTTGAIGGRA